MIIEKSYVHDITDELYDVVYSQRKRRCLIEKLQQYITHIYSQIDFVKKYITN